MIKLCCLQKEGFIFLLCSRKRKETTRMMITDLDMDPFYIYYTGCL